MEQLTTILKQMMRKKRKEKQCGGRELAENMAKEAMKKQMVLRSSGNLSIKGSSNFASVFSKRGEKGANQDRCIVWEEFGCQEDMMLCGIFDGHGKWGHFVANKVREAMPSSLLCNWQETLLEASLDTDFGVESEKNLLHHHHHHHFNIWKHSYLKTCAAIDMELHNHPNINAFYSGTTALTIVRQGDEIYIANVGDSRAVLGRTSSESNDLEAEQLTVDMKPNLPQEAARINECNGRVYSLGDEAGVHRLWLPNEDSPGLAMSRAFGDYCAKDFGLISVPHVTHISITARDRFVVVATDGVWDVVSNEEAVEIVAAAPERSKSSKRLVESAARAWRRKRKGIAMDDISAIVLFFHSDA